jgi:hypothetical protein
MAADGGAWQQCRGRVPINVVPFLTYVSVGMLNDLPPRSVAFEVL